MQDSNDFSTSLHTRSVELPNKRELAYEEKKKRRELYNKQLFEPSEPLQNKDYNPFYDNSYLHNISNSQVIQEKEPQHQENQLKSNNPTEKKDQMIQTDERFFPQKTEKVKPKEKEKQTVSYKPFFDPAADHDIFHKIKQDYQSYVRNNEGRQVQTKLEKKKQRLLEDTIPNYVVKQHGTQKQQPNDQNYFAKKYGTNMRSDDQNFVAREYGTNVQANDQNGARMQPNDQNLLARQNMQPDDQNQAKQYGSLNKEMEDREENGDDMRENFRYNQNAREHKPDFLDSLGQKQKKNAHSLDQRSLERKNEQKKYADELTRMVREKSQKKFIEKEKNDLLSAKLLRQSLENSPFGRAGGGAPNRDASGNLLLKKGIFVNDNMMLYKDNGESRMVFQSKETNLEQNINDSYEQQYRNNNNNNDNNDNNNYNGNFQRNQMNPQYNTNDSGYFYDQVPGSQVNQSYNQEFRNNNNNMKNPISQGYGNNQQGMQMIYPQYSQNNPMNQYINNNNNNQSPNYNNNTQNNNNNNNQQYFNQSPIRDYAQKSLENNNYNNNFNANLNNNLNSSFNANIPLNNQPSPENLRLQQTPFVPKVLDMKQIEREFLLQTEYNRRYKKEGEAPVDFSALKNANYFAFHEYDKKEQLKKYQEQIRLQRILYEQIEDKRRKKEEMKQAELLKQQQEEDRLKRQRDEIMEKYNKDMEKKLQELQAIKDSTSKPILKPGKEIATKTKDETLREVTHIANESFEEKEREDKLLMDEMKRREEEKIYEIQRQKAVYEEKLQDVNSHLVNLKNQLFSQQNMLSEELNRLKAEALVANEQRYRAQKDLESLREELKKQELMEELRRNELSQALLRTQPMRKDNNSLIYPKFARDFNKAYQFHQLNNDYINDSLDNLVQRTNFIPIVDYSKPIISNKGIINQEDDGFEYSNALTQATKVQTLPSSLVKGYNKGEEFNAMELIKTNEERLEELTRLDKGESGQHKLDSLINNLNRE